MTEQIEQIDFYGKLSGAALATFRNTAKLSAEGRDQAEAALADILSNIPLFLANGEA